MKTERSLLGEKIQLISRDLMK